MKTESACILVIRSCLLHIVFTSEHMCLCVCAHVHTIRGDAENSIFVYRHLCLPGVNGQELKEESWVK